MVREKRQPRHLTAAQRRHLHAEWLGAATPLHDEQPQRKRRRVTQLAAEAEYLRRAAVTAPPHRLTVRHAAGLDSGQVWGGLLRATIALPLTLTAQVVQQSSELVFYHGGEAALLLVKVRRPANGGWCSADGNSPPSRY